MRIDRRVRRGFAAGMLAVLAVLAFAGCGAGSSTGGGNSNVTLKIASKKDADGQLLGSMYALLLKKKGFTVTTQIPLGDTNTVESAIKNGQIDIFPEFTGTALFLLKQQPTGTPQGDYQAVKSAYKSQFQITWLDPAYGLNDSYSLCTSQAVATKYNLHSIDDVTANASKLTLTAQQDALDAVVKPLETAYNLHFKDIKYLDESLSFDAVNKGTADLNICYSTDPTIVTDNFVVLTDTKNAFPNYNPAPIVRDAILNANPSIADALNPLASHLTTDKIVQLIKKVSVDKQDPGAVAQAFLQSEGLL
jgi:osmoprotectant transport system substrate-binding protein